MAENYYTKGLENKLYQAGQTLVNKFGLMKKYFTFRPVFIGYGLKTGQGFYPGPNFLYIPSIFTALFFQTDNLLMNIIRVTGAKQIEAGGMLFQYHGIQLYRLLLFS